MTTLRPDEKYPQSSCADKNKPEVGTNKCKEGIKQSWWRGNYVTSRLFSILPISAWSEWKITASQRTHRHILVGNHETTEQYVLPKSKASTLLNPQLPTYFPTQLQDFEIMRWSWENKHIKHTVDGKKSYTTQGGAKDGFISAIIHFLTLLSGVGFFPSNEP